MKISDILAICKKTVKNIKLLRDPLETVKFAHTERFRTFGQKQNQRFLLRKLI